MKKLFMFFVAASITGTILAGGLVTNTNQSALYTRLQSRNASTGMDAVYYNPAGLTKLSDGFFFSVSNQTVGQSRTITSNYPYLSGEKPREFAGTVSAPLFPSVYAGYKTGKFAFAAAFNPIGGGGGATYEKGLPSFEMMVADIPPGLTAQGFPTTQYSADIFFQGSSTYFGYQFSAAYEVNDYISIGAGIRLVTAKNVYQGHLRNISINPNYPAFGSAFDGTMVLASNFFTAGATALGTLAGGATAYFSGLQPIIDGGFGATLLTDGAGVGLTPTDIATIQQIMGAAGQTPAQIGAATIGYAQAVLGASAPVFSAGSAAFAANAASSQDIEVDAEQTGRGYTPMIGVNFSFSDNLNVSFKYEFQTKLELTTTLIDNKGGGIFTEGTKTIADMPAMLATGFEYKPIDNLLLTGSLNLYFDNKVDYDGSADLDINMIEKNFKELAFGAQYAVNDKLRASAGWLGTYSGVNSNYINDQRYSANTNTFGGGVGYRITDLIDLNIGASYTVYDLAEKQYNNFLGGVVPVPILETYDKATWIVAVGLDFYFGK
ncbi:MAG: aromatic hydrocarbon degradation protein [Bacteroidales bacterium]|nr:aromatic hydrocarbon degradation protein [Bacteroidales bacterium]